MNLKQVPLQGTKEAIEIDIKALTWNGELVYPNWPNGYERTFNPHERFIVGVLTQLVTTPAIFNEQGSLIEPEVYGDWECILVLPANYDTSNILTAV